MTIDEAQSMLDDLDRPNEVWVSGWEADFIDSLMLQVDAGRAPTEKQAAMLTKIHKEKCR